MVTPGVVATVAKLDALPRSPAISSSARTADTPAAPPLSRIVAKALILLSRAASRRTFFSALTNASTCVWSNAHRSLNVVIPLASAASCKLSPSWMTERRAATILGLIGLGLAGRSIIRMSGLGMSLDSADKGLRASLKSAYAGSGSYTSTRARTRFMFPARAGEHSACQVFVTPIHCYHCMNALLWQPLLNSA